MKYRIEHETLAEAIDKLVCRGSPLGLVESQFVAAVAITERLENIAEQLERMNLILSGLQIKEGIKR